MFENFMNSLIIMGKGMLSIFVVIILIAVLVVVIGKVDNYFESKVQNEK